MRLWHSLLIDKLPCVKTTKNRKLNQLGGQHNEASNARGLGWGRKHVIVDYVYKYNYMMLYNYHMKVLKEMAKRGFNTDVKWLFSNYRGKKIGFVKPEELPNIDQPVYDKYPEHNNSYLRECLENLKNKGVEICTPINQ